VHETLYRQVNRYGFAVAASLVVVWLTGCGMRQETSTADRAALVSTVAAEESLAELAEARRATARLGGGLQKLLGEELAKGGFEGAAKVCSEQAQTLTEELQGPEGSMARRVSMRYRNPKDKPDRYEETLLTNWEARKAEGTLPEESAEVLRYADGRKELRYLKPIVVQPMCLSCHGSEAQIPAEVREIVEAQYPEDLATGYAAGDLRGAISVVMPVNEATGN
jgi:hypothetical protein